MTLSLLASPSKSTVGCNENMKTPRRESMLSKLKRYSKAADKRRPLLRQNPLTVNVQSANDMIFENLDDHEISFVGYSPELASLVTAGGRSKRWAFCLTPSVADEHDELDSAVDDAPATDRPPSTLYMFMDPKCDLSASSTDTEITMYVAGEEEIRKHPLGAELLSKANNGKS